MSGKKPPLPRVIARLAMTVDGKAVGEDADCLAAGGAKPFRVLVSDSGKVDLKDSRVVFSTTRMSPKNRLALAPVCDLHLFEAPAVPLVAALAILRADYGVKSLVCEGGGWLLRALATGDFIDEIRLEILPEVFGGAKTATITGPLGDFLPKPVDFRMVSMQVECGRCVAKYSRVSARAC